MIPNALTSRGPYATFWGHLKSIDNTLARALDEEKSLNLTELDRDRIEELINLLQGAIPLDSSESDLAAENLFLTETGRSDYSSAIDLRQRIRSHSAFQEWHKPFKRGFEASLQRLTKATEEYLDSLNGAMFSKNAPKEEFKVLRSIIQNLIMETETSLQS